MASSDNNPSLVEIDQKGLTSYLKRTFSLREDGFHGYDHWARVYHWAKRMESLEPTGTPLEFYRLFALLHDHLRINEEVDLNHGQRAANVLFDLRNIYFTISDELFADLKDAISMHNHPYTSHIERIQHCFDADRLDLIRLCITPTRPLISHTAETLIPEAKILAKKSTDERVKIMSRLHQNSFKPSI